MNFVRDGIPHRKRGRPRLSTGPSAFTAKKFKSAGVRAQSAPVSDDPVMSLTTVPVNKESDATIMFDLDINNLNAEREREEIKRLEKLDPHYARTKRFIYSDFQGICDTPYVNNNLKKHLENFNDNTKLKHLERILDQCYNFTNGDVKTCKLMMKKIEMNTSICLTNIPVPVLPDKKREQGIKKKRRRLKNIKIKELMERFLDEKVIKLFGEEFFQSDKDEILNKEITSRFDSSNHPNTSSQILDHETEISENGESKIISPVIQTVEKRYSRVISFNPNTLNGKIKIENEHSITKQTKIIMDKSKIESEDNTTINVMCKTLFNNNLNTEVVENSVDPEPNMGNVNKINDYQLHDVLNAVPKSINSDKITLEAGCDVGKMIHVSIPIESIEKNMYLVHHLDLYKKKVDSEKTPLKMSNVIEMESHKLCDVSIQLTNNDSDSEKSQLEMDNIDQIQNHNLCNDIVSKTTIVESTENNINNSEIGSDIETIKNTSDNRILMGHISKNDLQIIPEKVYNQVVGSLEYPPSEMDNLEPIKNHKLCNDVVNEVIYVDLLQDDIDNSENSVLEIDSYTEKSMITSENEDLMEHISKNDVQIIPEKVYNQVVGSLEYPPSEMDNLEPIKNHKLCNDVVNEVIYVDLLQDDIDNSENSVLEIDSYTEKSMITSENEDLMEHISKNDVQIIPEKVYNQVVGSLEYPPSEMDNLEPIKNDKLCNNEVNKTTVVELTENNDNNSDNPEIVESTQDDIYSSKNSLLEVGNDIKNTSDNDVLAVKLSKNNEITKSSEKSTSEMNIVIDIENQQLCNDLADIEIITDSIQEDINNSRKTTLEINPKNSEIWKPIILKISNIIDTNSNVFKKSVVTDLITNFSKTEFLFKPDLFWISPERVLIEKLLINLIEMFNNTKNNMAYLSGCLICVFREIAKKSSIPPHEMESKFNLFMYIIVRQIQCCNDEQFWNNWMISSTLFISWCFVVACIFIPEMKNNIMDFNEEKLCKEAIKYSDIVTHFEYEFTNKIIKPKSGIFEFTSSDDIDSLDSIDTDNSTNKPESDNEPNDPILSNQCIEMTNQTQNHHVEEKTQNKMVIVNKNDANNPINNSESNEDPNEPILSNQCNETINQTQNHHGEKKIQRKILSNHCIEMTNRTQDYHVEKKIESKNKANKPEFNEEAEDLILSNHCIDMTNQTQDYHMEKKTQSKILIPSNNEANNPTNKPESNEEPEDLILSNHCIDMSNQTQDYHTEKKTQSNILIQCNNEANNPTNKPESNEEPEGLILSNHCIDMSNQTQDYHTEKKTQSNILIQCNNEANNPTNKPESNEEPEGLILSNHCIDMTTQTQDYRMEKTQSKILIQSKNEANNPTNKPESNEEPEDIILSNQCIDMTNQTRDHHVEKKTKSKILTESNNEVLIKKKIPSKKKVQGEAGIKNKNKVQSNNKVKINKKVQSKNNLVDKIVICEEYQKNTFKKPVYLFNDPNLNRICLKANNSNIFKSLNKPPYINSVNCCNIQYNPTVRDVNVEPSNPTVTQISTTQAAPPSAYYTIPDDPQQYSIPGSSRTNNHLSPYYNNISASSSSSNLQPLVEPSPSTSLYDQSIVNMSKMSTSNNYLNNTYQSLLGNIAVNDTINTTTISRNQSNQASLPNTQFTYPIETSMLLSPSLNNIPYNQYTSYPEYSNTVNNIQQRSVNALPSAASSTVPSLRTHAIQNTYNRPIYNNPGQVDMNCLPAITTLGRNFQPPDYNTQVSPGLPDVRQQNMPNQLDSNVIANINSKTGCMHSNCTNATIQLSCCPSAKYCSYTCMRSDWHYHKNECSQSYSQ